MLDNSRSPLTGIDLSWIATLSLAIAAALAAVGAFAWNSSSEAQWARLSTGLLIASAALFIGGLIGFLFGIPRTLQQGEPTGTSSEAGDERQRYQGNTNLEQISDWLTKILVGVGLTQLDKIPKSLQTLSHTLGAAFGVGDQSDVFVSAVLVFFCTAGFLFTYLWTRLFLAGALVRADLGAVVKRVADRLSEQEETSQADAVALSAVHVFLQPDSDGSATDVSAMKVAIRRSSPGIKVQTFYKAESLRRQTWRTNKALMERTIPIFEALAESDTRGEFHQNHGQLSYALKDQRRPDWARAETELTKAIELRGPDVERRWAFYEFNRAVCRIMLDPDYKNGKPSTPERRQGIAGDISAFRDGKSKRLLAESPIKEWLELNG